MATSDHQFDETSPRTVSAAQVVFANLEAHESPHGERGFQIAFHTQPDLDPETIRVEIQPSLFYYRRSGYDDPQKLPPESVFFRTKSGRVVLIRITPVFDELDIFGRPKTLFAHALIFEADDFRAAFQNDPFQVFDTQRFFRSYDDVIKAGGEPRNSQLHRARLTALISKPAAESKYFQALRSNPQHLRLMLLLASHASNPRERRFTLQFDGPAGGLMDFLRDLMRLLLPSQRTACSFDTLFVGDDGSIKSGQSPHWANGVGRDQYLRQPGIVRYHLESGQFLSDTGLYTPETPYESWLDSAFKAAQARGELPTPESLRAASTLQDLCWGRSPDDAEIQAVPEPLFRDFLKVNETYIRRLLLKNLQKCPGPAVAEKLVAQALDWIAKQGAAGLSQVTRRIPRERLVEWLLPGCLAQVAIRVPDVDELKAIEKCLELDDATSERNDGSRLLAALLWTWRREWEKLALAVESLSRKAFQEFVPQVLQTVRFRTEINTQIAPATGAVGFYTFISEQSGGNPPQELIAALLGYVFRGKIAPGVETLRVAHAERQRWDVVTSALQDSPLQLDFDSDPSPAQSGDRAEDPHTTQAAPHRIPVVEVPQIMASYRVTPTHWETVGCWSSLPEDTHEVRELLRCVPDHQNRPTYAFITHTVGRSRRAIIAQITKTSLGGNDPAIFVHALLPDLDTFRTHFANDPFRLLSSGAFRTMPPESPSDPDADCQMIRPARVPTSPGGESASPPRMELAALPAETVKLLLLLAVLAQQTDSSRRGGSLRLLNDTAQSVDLLRGLFAVLPPGLRPACSFHTWYVNESGGRIQPDSPYWGIGLPQRAGSGPKTEVTFSLTDHQVSSRMELNPPTSPFALWIKHAINDELLENPRFIDHVHDAYVYEGLCCGEDVPLPETAGPAYPAFLEAIRSLVFKRLCDSLEAPFAEEYLPALMRWHMAQHPRRLKLIGPWLQQLTGPLATDTQWLHWLTDWTSDTLLAQARPPSHEVLNGIGNLISSTSTNWPAKNLLILMRLRWLSKWTKLADSINKVDVATFRRFARWCLKTLLADQGFPFLMNWSLKIDSRGALQFGPVLKPSLLGEDAFGEARSLLAALVGFAFQESVYRTAKSPAPKLELVDISAKRFLPDLLSVLQAHAHPGGSV